MWRSKRGSLQYEEPTVSQKNAILPVPLVLGSHDDQDNEAIPAITADDDDEEFFDASADSKPSSRNTIKNAATFNNAKPASREIKPGQDGSADDQQLNEKNNHIAPVAVAAAAAAAATVATSRSIGKTDVAPNSTADSLHESQHETMPEKVFTKAETDALIASAVAMALANTAAAQKKEPVSEVLDIDDLEDDSKRHTCDMSHNNNSNSIAPNHDVDSAVVSHSSGIVSRDEEEPISEEDYGNVVVHLPREEDTITSSPYHEKRQQQRELEELAILNRHDQAHRAINGPCDHL
ncbi:hypothetical protein G6F42_026024 [Rhizopus arrhizus]|nr:hypothetical protein G6F42_026024 [Rhizopus arrhizus]